MIRWLEITEVKPCPGCAGGPLAAECLLCDGWGQIPQIHKIDSVTALEELLVRIHRANLKATKETESS